MDYTYTSEDIMRVLATRLEPTQEQAGAKLVKRWIKTVATYDQIESTAAKFNCPAEVLDWIKQTYPGLRTPALYRGFNEEVRRFWDQLKGKN